MRRMVWSGLKCHQPSRTSAVQPLPLPLDLAWGRMRTGQLGRGHWARAHAQAPVQGQGCCGLVRQVGSRCLWRIGWRPLFLRAPASRPASAWSGLHTPPPPGSFSVKQRCGQDHGWLATLCPSAQRDLTIPPVGPVIERNPARVCSVLHSFPVKFICSGELERESETVSKLMCPSGSCLSPHSGCTASALWETPRAWPCRNPLDTPSGQLPLSIFHHHLKLLGESG